MKKVSSHGHGYGFGSGIGRRFGAQLGGWAAVAIASLVADTWARRRARARARLRIRRAEGGAGQGPTARRPREQTAVPPKPAPASNRDSVDQASWESFPASDPPAW